MFFVFFFVFVFFQAEDGIRDLVRSRGLGDVYKRQGFLLNRWGEKRSELGFMIKVPIDLAVRYSVAYVVILLAAVLVSAKFIGIASDSFNVHATFYLSLIHI